MTGDMTEMRDLIGRVLEAKRRGFIGMHCQIIIFLQTGAVCQAVLLAGIPAVKCVATGISGRGYKSGRYELQQFLDLKVQGPEQGFGLL